MILLEKLKILAHTQILPKTVGDLSKLIVAKGFKKLPKVQKIAKSGHTAYHHQLIVTLNFICVPIQFSTIETTFLLTDWSDRPREGCEGRGDVGQREEEGGRDDPEWLRRRTDVRLSPVANLINILHS